MSEPELKHLNPKQTWELLQQEPRAILVDMVDSHPVDGRAGLDGESQLRAARA
jgi:hypothetical protein